MTHEKKLNINLRNLGVGGGKVSPSVYDTATVASLYPSESSDGAIQWLIDQQSADGGWKSTSPIVLRIIPTVAALIAINKRSKGMQTEIKAVSDGITFLHNHKHAQTPQHIDQLPIGGELILPWLIETANEIGLHFSSLFHQSPEIEALRNYKLTKIRELNPTGSSPLLHTWEAWGENAVDLVVMEEAGVGHSPAATAAWLSRRTDKASTVGFKRAKQYLYDSSSSVSGRQDGLYPTVWPVDLFEILFPLYISYTFEINHLLDENVVNRLLSLISSRLEKGALGHSSYFDPDGDDTAAGLAIMLLSGKSCNLDIMEPFRSDDHFVTYSGEANLSLSTTARATHVLQLSKQFAAPYAAHLFSRQMSNSLWPSDKWHASSMYTTLHCLIALQNELSLQEIRRIGTSIIEQQNTDAGWGRENDSVTVDTSYAILSLALLYNRAPLKETKEALCRAYDWLDKSGASSELWIGKETYSQLLVDDCFKLIALIVTQRLFDELR